MFNFILTENCDWGCPYCVVKNDLYCTGNTTTKEIVDKHLPYIKEIQEKVNFTTIIQGGEVGKVPIKLMRYFFELWNDKILVSTNGEFLRRNYHKDETMRPYIDHIMLHAFGSLPPIKEELDYDYEDDDIFIDIGICTFLRFKPNRLRTFLQYNEHFTFNFIDYENEIGRECKTSPSNSYVELYDVVKDLDNVTDDAKERILNRMKNTDLEYFQDSCSAFNNVFTIDLVNERICKCIRNYKECYIPLNKENLIEVMTNINVFPIGDECDSCFRICQDHSISEKIQFRSKYKDKL